MSTMSTNVCLALLIGLPGSGKSSLAKFLKNFYLNVKEATENSLSLNVIHICYDDFINSGFAHSCITDHNYDNGEWRHARQEVLVLVQNVITVLKKNLLSNSGTLKFDIGGVESKALKLDPQWEVDLERRTLIVIDDNMYYSSMRYLYFQLAKLHNLGFCQIYLECSPESAMTFNSQRPQGEVVPYNIISRMAHRMEPPGSKPWEHFSVSITAHKVFDGEETIQRLTTLISKAFLNPIKPEVERPNLNQTPVMANIYHQADLGLRSLVNKRMKILKMSSVKTEDLKKHSCTLNASRVNLLESIKTGKVIVPDDLCMLVHKCHPSARDQLQTFLSSLLPF